MAEKVIKPFNTVNRRFKPGMDVTEADIAPLDFEQLKKSGFIGTSASEARPRLSKPGADE